MITLRQATNGWILEDDNGIYAFAGKSAFQAMLKHLIERQGYAMRVVDETKGNEEAFAVREQ